LSMQRSLFNVARATAARGFQSRGFAAAAARPKLKIYSPSGEYAHSLLEATVDEKADVKGVSAYLQKWSNILESNPEMMRYLDDQEFSWTEKEEKIVSEVMPEYEMTGESAELEIAQEMISVCIEENTMSMFAEIAEDFDALALDHVKEVKCTVTSAQALTPAQTQKIQTQVSKMVDPDQKAMIDYEVDEEIVGGLTLLIGSKFQDLSVRSAIFSGEQALRAL